MKINNANNKTNFGISHVGVTSPNKRFIEFVRAAEAEIKAIGDDGSICGIFDQEIFPKFGQVCVMVIAKGDAETIAGGAKGLASTKEQLLEIIHVANNQMNQRFFNRYHGQVTAKPELDVAGRPRLSVVK